MRLLGEVGWVTLRWFEDSISLEKATRSNSFDDVFGHQTAIRGVPVAFWFKKGSKAHSLERFLGDCRLFGGS